ncbi:hypothetical protein Taro_019588 [Colocasia esculenta]|uniref:Retrotransposon gag domain-containing protein n=1 Tax=Colocasia esculenta TaxID=4460 RepID=A0A843V2M9_COLES|nr:hypothetical protein [Colocasia esculenta]
MGSTEIAMGSCTDQAADHDDRPCRDQIATEGTVAMALVNATYRAVAFTGSVLEYDQEKTLHGIAGQNLPYLTQGDKLLLATFQLEKDAHAWCESVEATRANGQFTWTEFKEAFNSKYFSERVQERKATEFAALKQRSLTVAEYEAQFSRLARYAEHLVNMERMKAKRFLNGLKPQYITQLAPLDIQTYAKMVKKAQLLEDAMDFTDRIKGKFMKKEMTSG